MSKKGTLKFYKKGGAAQLRLIPPRLNEKGFLEKEGAVLLEAAPGTGNGRDLSWDWSKKIVFAISFTDITNIFNGDTIDIFHQSEDTPKKLQIIPGQNSGFFLNLAEGKGDSRRQVKVSLTDGEWRVLRQTLMQMVPFLVGWEEDHEEIFGEIEALREEIREFKNSYRRN
jgi:hypothetical protein